MLKQRYIMKKTTIFSIFKYLILFLSIIYTLAFSDVYTFNNKYLLQSEAVDSLSHQKIDILTQLEAVDKHKTAIVSDVKSGGTFIYNPLRSKENDGVTVFNGWERTAYKEGKVLLSWAGAKGDGQTDDTVAIQKALNTDAKEIVGEGTFVISDPLKDGTPTLLNTTSNRTIYIKKLTAHSTVLKAFQSNGNGCKITMEIAGNHKIASAIKVVGNNNEISESYIKDLYTPTYSAIGIQIVGSYNKVKNNTLNNFEAAGDKKLGNGNGMSRAILISSKKPVGGNIVEKNDINNIIGEEGDAIVVIASNHKHFLNSEIIIRNNNINNFTRRGIKVQAQKTKILENYFKSNIKTTRAMSVIDFVQGGDHICYGNIIDGCILFSGISVYEPRGS
ncbi:MAG TPA: hypothetical protein ENK66_08960, partial [Arcobacter sp.]|nr:hypothetical protein [Arcobacter sp.]